jgi:hypothetical protein
MKKLIYLMVVIAILGLIVSGCFIPLKSVVPTSEKGNPKHELGAPKIERGVFVDYGYSSPPWYPPEEATDRYKWGPKIDWAREDLPVDISIYTKYEPISGTFEAIESGFTIWDDETGTSLYGSITEKNVSESWPGIALDDENTVAWGAIDGPGGIIGVTYYWYYTASKEMVEFDIVLDFEESWSLTGEGDTFDVQNIATHEAGHTLVLGDLRSPKDGALTMHAYTWLGDTVKRTLGSGDILGVQAIYGE